ncbi:MAG: phage tail tape measure protein, partial [Xanthomonadaceae bacterium]|nr:phage tail tape measure protein [Xanthomonadaceae bacterium]
MLASNIFKAIGSYGQGQSGWVGAALSMFGGAHAYGNVFNGGALIPHANGGVIGNPTLFPMSGGRTGLMGEAGPEAIMPLVRASTGHLGVRAVGGGGGALAVRIVNNIDPQTISDALATSAGEKVILNTIRRNTAGIKQLLR